MNAHRLSFTFRLLLTICLLSPDSALPGTGIDSDFFPFGVFDKSDPYGRFDPRPFEAGSKGWLDYRKKFTHLLDRHNINTVIATKYTDDDHARIAYDMLMNEGIRVIHQPTGSLRQALKEMKRGDSKYSIYRHPAIIAFKVGNEPKDEKKLRHMENKYRQLRKHFDKPIITAIIGELMGDSDHELLLKGDTDDFSSTVWEELEPEIIFARHYTFRREYDLLNWYREKMRLPFAEWCDYMETAYDGKPWWFIPQLFGKGKEKDHRSYWRFPTADELNAQVHTALAYGARGIIGWGMPSYDTAKKSRRTLLTTAGLEPEVARDGSVPLEQYGRIGALVQQHGGLLKRHARDGYRPRDKNAEVLEVARLDPKDGTRYIYTVNLNTESGNRETLVLPASYSSARDIFSGRKVDLVRRGDDSELSYELTPGEAMFIQLR